jgi:peptidyl-prolyl cis-trans isomerase SurA
MPITQRRSFLPLVLSLAALAAGACKSQTGTTPVPDTTLTSDVWAVVDGQEVRREDIDKAYRRTVPPSHDISDEEATSTNLKLLDGWITQEVLLARAKALNVSVSDAELDEAIKNGTGGMPDENLNKELAARNLTAADMRDTMRRDLLIQKLMDREVSSKVVVSNEDITAFFEANRSQFNLTEDAYRLAQIIVTPVRDAGLNNRTGDDATTPQAAEAKVQMVMERLKGGAPFNEVAMDYSEEPQSAQQGGEIGLVPVSALKQAPPQLRDAVLKLPEGGVSVVNLQGAYTVVAMLGKQTAGQRDPNMPEVRDGIIATIRERREELLRAAYVEAARDQATITNNLARQLVESQGKLPGAPVAGAPK